jgi:hypothetical protein
VLLDCLNPKTKMKNRKKIIVVAIAAAVATQTLLAGSWFAGCTIKVRNDWTGGVGFDGKTSTPWCVIPNDYYTRDNTYRPFCNGYQYSEGFCDSSKWSWGCDSSKLNGYGWKMPIAGTCIQQYNPDGTIVKFKIPCINPEPEGERIQIRTQCSDK